MAKSRPSIFLSSCMLTFVCGRCYHKNPHSDYLFGELSYNSISKKSNLISEKISQKQLYIKRKRDEVIDKIFLQFIIVL